MTEQTAYELFASDEQVAELEARYATEPEASAMPLAWALRQRDPSWSLSLARAAAESEPALLPRLWLIEGERAVAHGRRDEAQALCERAQAAFKVAGDRVGGVDTLLLAATIVREHSTDPEELVPPFVRVLAQAEAAGEAGRLMYCRINLARFYGWASGGDSDPRCQPLLPPPEAELHSAAAAILSMYWAYTLACRGDNAGMLQRYAQAHALALQSGQGMQAAVAATALAYMHDEVGESALALEWARVAASLARQIWPARLSECLCVNARLLRRLEQLPEARELALECIQLESAQPQSRASAHAQLELGLIELDAGHLKVALGIFDQGLTMPEVRTSRRFVLLLDRADVLLRLERYGEAEASLNQALQMDAQQTVAMQRLQARALLADAWLGQGRLQEAQQAYAALLADGEAQPGFKPLASTLEGAARAHAAVGLLGEAYALSRRAGEALKSRHTRQAEQTSRALYLQFRTERSALEAEHLRSLAQAADERLSTLERSHAVLDELGAIGRELTAQLDTGRALVVLAERVQSLLPVDCLIVYLFDAGSQRLQCALCENQGRAVALPDMPLDSAESLVARCARERQVLLLQDEASESLGIRLEGWTRKRSMMFAPLIIGTRLVGVMSVQSGELGVFVPESQLIFGTLCAYAAIALDNARAYQQLQQMQRQLRAQERMAALGSMVAGVAHELNTPLGNALLAVSTLTERSADLEQRMGAGTLRRSDLQQFSQAIHSGLGMITNGVDTSLRLVNNFRQVAQRRDAEQRRRFSLAALCRQSLVMRTAQAERGGHAVEIDVPGELELNSYAYAIDQALDILVGNALQHGLGERKPGRVRLRAERINGEHCRLEVIDDGCGMKPEVLARAFEPFFTTTFGQGGNGLGLSICHTLVADVLGGQIEAFSEAGQGSRFVMELPLRAP